MELSKVIEIVEQHRVNVAAKYREQATMPEKQRTVNLDMLEGQFAGYCSILFKITGEVAYLNDVGEFPFIYED